MYKISSWNMILISNDFWHKRNINCFDPYDVFLAIATNIPQRLKTAVVLQGHIYCHQMTIIIREKPARWALTQLGQCGKSDCKWAAHDKQINWRRRFSMSSDCGSPSRTQQISTVMSSDDLREFTDPDLITSSELKHLLTDRDCVSEYRSTWNCV